MAYSLNPVTEGGLSIFLAGSLYSYIAKKYFPIEGCNINLQIGAFAIAGIAKTLIPHYFENDHPGSFYRRNAICYLVLVGAATKYCQFKGCFFKHTTRITVASLGTSWVVCRFFRKKLSANEFKQRLMNHTLPNSPVFVEGNLTLRDSDYNLQLLPKALFVEGNLTLQEPSLKELPNWLHVKGSLNLSNCHSLTSLPEGLDVGEKLIVSPTVFLSLRAFEKVNSLPKNLHVEGDLELGNDDNLTILPLGLSVSGDLDLSLCTSLRWFPRDLRIGKRLIVSPDQFDCLSFYKTYFGIDLGFPICVSGGLFYGPPKDSSRNACILNERKRLTSLPENLHIGGNLPLMDALA